MASPPPKRILTLEDVPGAPKWLEGLLGPVNGFFKPTSDALSQGLTFRENFAGEVKTVTITPSEEWQPIEWANDWGANPSYVAPAWRQTLDGRVELRGVGARASAPSSGSNFITGLPPPVGVETFAVQSNSGVGTADLVPSGTLLYYSGGNSLWPLTAVSYVAADRSPPRWASPVDVKLGTTQKPFPGRPGAVIVLGARQVSDPAAPAVVTGWDITAINLEKQKSAPGIRIHRVWGLVPGVAYSLTLLVLPE